MNSEMIRRVAILPDAVANQIAAGEVVDRPASVVKELVENAIDAGATRIRVEIEEGGKSAIIVSDDGVGMNREDAILALDRHATSKITTAADLIGVPTFGFRGEALPAIASVSRFTLSTFNGEGEATELSVTGGRLDRVTTVARQRGTTVTVRNLFFNTPARRKFLRSVSSELRAIWEAMGVLALANPGVGFELISEGGNRLLVPPGQDDVGRLSAVWGRDLVATMIPVQLGTGGIWVEGLIQRPADAKPTGRRVLLLVNGRPFRDPGIARSAEGGYRSAIAPGDRPSLLLRLMVAPQDVDVNVHPAKLEVRFRERFAVERAVEEAVREALGSLQAAVPLTPIADRPTGQLGGSVAGSGWPSVASRPPDGQGPLAPGSSLGLESSAPRFPLDFDPPKLEGGDVPRFFGPLLQVNNTYIVYETPAGIAFVDQHSAHERVLYQRVIDDWNNGVISSQRLLLPITIELTDEELSVIETFGEELSRIGFECEPFGGRSVVLHAVPAPHPRFDAGACFRELVADLARGRFGGWANRFERFAATFACRAAVKGGMPLTDQEMRTLLTQLFAAELAPHDVHGRSTIVSVSVDELERRFGRR